MTGEGTVDSTFDFDSEMTVKACFEEVKDIMKYAKDLKIDNRI